MNVVSWTAIIVITLIIQCHVGSCFKNFALNKVANQSSTLPYFFDWTADKAVDGNTNGTNPDNSKTCSATNGNLGDQTWEVDIGFLIIVRTITVYERTDGNDQLSGFKVFIGNTTKSWTGNQPLVEVQPVSTQHKFRVNDSLAQFVSVIRQKLRAIMVICEVIVEGECQKGTFGDVCNETCGNCLYGNVSCNGTTGQCTEGCAKGWSGETCKEGCKIGAYGYGCNETCGMCIGGNNNCSTTDGHCMLGCTAGWQGETCKQECSKGAYGDGCNETCGMCFGGNNSCSTNNGHCNVGCEAGWQGETCKQECSKGAYGDGCNETCGMCFRGNDSCLKNNGHCQFGCEAGWWGATCKLECAQGTYSYGCNETCGMCFSGKKSCSSIDGHCNAGCEAGWEGGACKQECQKGTYGYGCNSTCGMCLHGNSSCSTIDGKCNLGCKAGWRGETCIHAIGAIIVTEESILPAPVITPLTEYTVTSTARKREYGYGFNETCGQCLHGADSCSIINGTCIDGCQDGWKDAKCTLETPSPPENGIIIIGVVVPGVIVIILLIIVLVILRVKRKRSCQC